MSFPLRIYKSCLFQFSPRVFGSLNGHLPLRSLDHVYREVFCRLGSTFGPSFITMKPNISRFVTNKGSRQGKLRSQIQDEACLKRRYHTGYVAIENANTIEECRSKIIRSWVFYCHLSPHWRQMAIKTLFLSIFDPRSSIVDSVFDCRLPGVAIVYIFSKPRPKDQS